MLEARADAVRRKNEERKPRSIEKPDCAKCQGKSMPSALAMALAVLELALYVDQAKLTCLCLPSTGRAPPVT